MIFGSIKLETSTKIDLLGLVEGDFFTDCTRGFITIIHHHLGKNIVCFFQASYLVKL